MTKDQVCAILKNEADKNLIIALLACVNLTDQEFDVIRYRYMRGLTQEQTAEKMDIAVNSVYNKQESALKKISEMWGKLALAKAIFKQISTH